MLRRRNSFSKIHLLLAVFLLYLSIHFSPVPIRLLTSFVSANRSISQSYTIHDAITIANDGELAAVANSGTGTANAPYIIASWNIAESPSHGISIIGTTMYFKIENCWISSSNSHGIYVDSVASGTATITNNTCNNNGGIGIVLEYSNFSTVANNTCNNNGDDGLNLGGCVSSIIANNTCDNNGGTGIRLEDSVFSTVVNNTCNNNGGTGIRLEDCGFSIVTYNTCNDNIDIYIPFGGGGSGSGISLGSSDSSTVTHNTCQGNDGSGISLEDSDSSTVTNNTCNNNSLDGLGLEDSGFSTVANNTCNNNDECGIYLYSGFSIVANNTCNDNDRIGIFLGSYDNNLIVWNTLVRNGVYGIELSDNSYNNVIHHNNFITNGQNTSQACDNGIQNQWYDDTVLEGNYWSDYSGTGSYSIDGSARAFDLYPILSRAMERARFFSLLGRIGLFLVVIGFLVVVLFVNRRKISS